MESDDQPTSEAKGSDEQGAGGSSHVTRSYECIFCKRGFSNAQALGGHMNIHRKDKAKLKQPSPHHHQHKAELEDRRTNPNWPTWNIMEDASSRDHHIRQLPLFAETPCDGETQKPQELGQVHDREKGMPSSDLDLELRLGPHHPQDPSPTIKFF